MDSARIIIAWLRSSEEPKAQRIADQLEKELREFAKTVDEEIADIRRVAMQPECRMGVVIFTNRLARAGKFLYCRDSVDGFQEGAIEVPDQENYILASNPLPTPAFFDRALRAVAALFPTQDHLFVLATKSHGNQQMALTPRVAVRWEETNREEVLSVATGDPPEGTVSRWSSRLGIARDAYFGAIDELGRSEGMTFSLVLMESCGGTVKHVLESQIPQNVRCLLVDPKPEAYSNLDYAELISRHVGGESVASAIRSLLSSKFTAITRSSRGERWSSWYSLPLYFLPLLLWLGWTWRRFRRRASREGPASPS